MEQLTVQEKIKSQLPECDELLESTADFEIYRLGRESIESGTFTRSVFRVYSDIYGGRHSWAPNQADYREMLDADVAAAQSARFYGAKVDGLLVGTGKIGRYDKSGYGLLPIEAEFGISVHRLTEEYGLTAVWHAGRIAIDKVMLAAMGIKRNRSVAILQRLLRQGLLPLVEGTNDAVLVEIDEIFLRITLALGIRLTVVGEARDWLGSPTIPAMLRSQQLRQIPWMQGAVQQ